GVGRWNLDLGEISPQLTLLDGDPPPGTEPADLRTGTEPVDSRTGTGSVDSRTGTGSVDSPTGTESVGPRPGTELVEVLLPRFDTAEPGVMRRGVPARRIGGHLVTTVFDLMLAHYGVHRSGLPGQWPTGYDDATQPYTPAWQQAVTS